MVTYHRRLPLPYDLTLFATDLLLVGMSVAMIRMLEASVDPAVPLNGAMWLGMTVFVLLFVRQIGSYTRLTAHQFETAGITKAELITPMVADFAGVAICAAILLTLSDVSFSIGTVEAWSGVAFAAALVYFVVKFLMVRISVGPRR